MRKGGKGGSKRRLIPSHRLRVRQVLGEVKRHANLIRIDVRIRGNDGTSGEIDAFAHHVLSEESFLLFQDLLDSLKG